VNPELAAQLDEGHLAPAVNPALAATGIYLCRPEGWSAQLERWLAAIAADEQAAWQSQQASGTSADPDALRAAQAQATAQLAAAEVIRLEQQEELLKLRKEQRRLRADVDRARAAARQAEQRADQERERLAAVLAERDGLVRQAESQVRQAREQLASSRRTSREGRSMAELRARLLLDTIVDSAAALRRELALPPAAQTPADLVAEQLTTGEPASAVQARGLAADDPAWLTELLKLPRAHLLVDGYNVTMEGFGGLPLVDQRRLLIDGLSALAARTSAEVTCCFDGAEVPGRTQGLVRGVRVLFSDPGMTADELIRRLVRAEPQGRVVVVVSSDGEVATGAVAAGARSVPSATLLRLLGPGLRDRRR
jgi:predicted RNA-binding protein with PIN domain